LTKFAKNLTSLEKSKARAHHLSREIPTVERLKYLQASVEGVIQEYPLLKRQVASLLNQLSAENIETIEGAQTKANAAEENAINAGESFAQQAEANAKAYAETMPKWAENEW